jgi:amino acid adenylation domain-containing protein
MDRQLSHDVILAGNQRTTEREYWLKKLSGEFHRGGIPYDFAWSPQHTLNRTTEIFPLPPDLTLACLRLANNSDNNFYLIVCSCLVILLHKYVSSSDLVIGSPVLKNEFSEELLNTVIPLRVTFQEDMTFRQMLIHVKEIYLEGIAHQNYPIEMLAAQFGYDGHGAFPLFDMVVLFDTIHLQQPFRHSNVSMILAFKSDNANTISLEITYNAALYEKVTIERFFRQFIYLAGQALEYRNDRAIRDLEVAAQEDCYRLLYGLNRTEAHFPEDATITHLFEETVKRFPENVALQYDNVCLTYTELNSRANRLARLLRARGGGPETIIGIYTERSLEMIVSMLAVLKAGAAYLPLDPNYPPERIKYMLEDSQALIVCTQSHLAGDLPASCDLILLDDEANYRESGSNEEALHTPGNLAYIIYTSGTTGRPKGVMVEHRQVVRLLKNDKFQFNFDEHDTWTLFHSSCFDFSVWEMYGALLYGGRLIVIPQVMTLDFSAYLRLLREERVTVLNQTPSAFFRLAEEESKSETHTLALRYVIFGGEELKPGRLSGWHQLYPDVALINMYGITETTVHVTYKEITQAEIRVNISNIGLPLPTTSVYILDSTLKPVPVGMIGEIFVGGEGVARGYLNRPDLTHERFLENPFRQGDRIYRTGDLGRWVNTEEIEYIGRVDQQVKIRGFRIEVGEIESQILMFPGVTNTAVVPVEDTHGERSLCAYIVCESSIDSEQLILNLKEQLKRLLPIHMLPAFLIPLAELPLTEHGKLNREKLPDPRQFLERGKQYVAPRSQLERQVVQVWAEVLQISEDKIGIHDRFFDLGGDSFLVLTLNNRLQEVLNQQISIISYFRYPTIQSFVSHIDSIGENGEQIGSADEETESVDSYSMMAELSQLAGGRQGE